MFKRNPAHRHTFDIVMLIGALLTTVFALIVRDYTVTAILTVVALYHTISIARFTRVSSTALMAGPAIESSQAKFARVSPSIAGGLKGIPGFVDEEIHSTPRALETNYVSFVSRPASATGSDLLDLESMLQGRFRSSSRILVMSEFKTKKIETTTLVSQIETGGPLQQLICRGIFEGVDVIPHVGKDAWQKRAEINAFLTEVAGEYSHVVIWLPENDYFAWTGVLNHFGNATTRLLSESVI